MDVNEYLRVSGGGRKTRQSVFVVDNQPLYRQAIRQVLREHMEVLGESNLTINVWSIIESLSPDIALVDVGLPSLNGFSIIRQIVAHCPGLAVVVFTSSPNDDQLFQAIKAGAVALLSKDISADGLVAILKKVGQGERPINETLLSRPGTTVKVLQLFHDLFPDG